MTLFLSIIAFFVIFSLLVLIHEWGHFSAARRAGVKVEEFGFGLPPRIWGKKKGETLYSINWIPFGGFVKLFGEDAHDPKILKNKRSFASKSPWVRMKIIVAGVVMNLLLAFVLLTAGFTFGIQPLIVDSDGVLQGIREDVIHLETGVVVKSVEDDSPAFLNGLREGDRILSVNGAEIDSVNSEIEGGAAEVLRDGQLRKINIPNMDNVVFYDLLPLPRLRIANVKENSASADAGLKSGDTIKSINGFEIFYNEDYRDVINATSVYEYEVLRGTEIFVTTVNVPTGTQVIASNVLADSPAENGGMLDGDLILSVNGQRVSDPMGFIEITSANAGKELQYEIARDGGEIVNLNITPSEDGTIGIILGEFYPYNNNELSLYSDVQVNSVLKIDNVRYPIWQAPIKAIEDIGRISLLTVDMLGNVVGSLVTSFSVPDGVAGPVGIAQLTFDFVQEGLLSLVRFTALLSLSLAVLNIFPFPALDGGRALFIIIEVVRGKRLSPRVEAMIHAIGFLLLMLLIFVITYNDILRFFK